MNDDRILQLFLSRDEEAIRMVEEGYGDYCRSIADRLLAQRDDVEECLNDTWLKAWNSIPPNRPASMKLYLARICRNLAINRRQAEGAAKRSGAIVGVLDELAYCIPDGQTVEDTVQAQELQMAMNRFLETLPERERSIFLRRYFYVESAEKIAARFGLRVNNVNTILFRVRKKLKQYLIKEEFV